MWKILKKLLMLRITTKKVFISPTLFIKELLENDPSKSWKPSMIAQELYEAHGGERSYASIRLSAHTALRGLVAKGIISKSEPDCRSIRWYKWGGIDKEAK